MKVKDKAKPKRGASDSEEGPDLQSLLHKARKAAPRPPGAVYLFLRRLYYAVRMTRKNADTSLSLREIGEARYPHPPSGVRLVVELGCPDHVTNKMKHKYTKVLEYALKKKIKAQNLEKFIKSKGGLNACIGHMAKS